MDGHTPQFLKAARSNVSNHTDCYKQEFIPDDYLGIKKIKTLTFPDGRVPKMFGGQGLLPTKQGISLNNVGWGDFKECMTQVDKKLKQ